MDVRDSFIVTYSGEYSTRGVPLECEGIVDSQMSQCRLEWDCKCQDVANNTYLCIRKINGQENSIVCQFDDEENFVEAYNLNEDPYQLNNVILEGGKHDKIQYNWIASSREEMETFIKGSTKDHQQFYDKYVYGVILHYMKDIWHTFITYFNI